MSIDTNSDDWREIKEFCKARIHEMRVENDGSLGKKETEKLRGKIAFAKELLDIGKKEKKPEVSSQGYL